MKTNIGKTDRAGRFLLAILIAVAGVYFKSWWGLLAIVPLLTTIFSFCPLYKIFGLNTCSHKSVQ